MDAMMDMREAALALEAQATGANVTFSAVSSDTRSILPGALFVALRGERYDGHDYLAVARERGAAAAMVDRRFGESGIDLPLLRVDDTRLGLGRLAAYWRRKFRLPLITVAGSNGKTTVKSMIAAILAEHAGEAHAYATPGNLNNDIGVPLTLLGLRARHACAVIELGMNHAGETAYLAGIAQPMVALVNNAQREHQEFMHSVEEVAREHGAAYAALPENGVAVVNADDAYAAFWRGVCGARRIVDFGLQQPAQVSGRYELRDFGSDIILRTEAGVAEVRLQAAGLHNVRNALAAAAAAAAAGVGLGAIVRGLDRFEPVAGRLQQKVGKHGATVLDDTYNANPDSVMAAIAVLARCRGKRILVLGEMGEVGEQGAAFHAEAGAHARTSGLERLFALGAACLPAVAEFGAGASHYVDIESMIVDLEAELDATTTVLVKGSRYMRMERVVQVLTGTRTEVH